MAEAITVARPYAHAVFAVAKEEGRLKQWSELLEVLALCVADADLQRLITSPAVSDEQTVEVLVDITADLAGESARNFLSLLAENNRLLLLDDIAVIFEELRAEAEQSLTAEVISAKPLTDEQANKISAALNKRLGRDISLEVSIDESLLGGAIIRAGDLVIDGSALGKLNRLANALS